MGYKTKEAKAAYGRAYRTKHKEDLARRRRIYYDMNVEAIKGKERARYWLKRDEILIKVKARRVKDPAKLRLTDWLDRKLHPENHLCYSAKTRAKKKGRMPK